MRRVALGGMVAAIVLAGCGRSDTEEATQVVRDFVDAANQHDADRLCGDLVSDAFVQQTTFATGDEARQACRDQLKVLRGPPIALNGIAAVRVDGERATVVTQLDVGGERRDEVFGLVKEDGEFRVNSGTVDR